MTYKSSVYLTNPPNHWTVVSFPNLHLTTWKMDVLVQGWGLE